MVAEMVVLRIIMDLRYKPINPTSYSNNVARIRNRRIQTRLCESQQPGGGSSGCNVLFLFVSTENSLEYV